MATVVRPTNHRLQRKIEELAPWFHNLHLPDGTQTAPDHPLGDFPRKMWRYIAAHVPQDLAGWSVLDVGCNAGYYTLELARRGARVTALDCDPRYLKQARWAAQRFGLQDRIRFRLDQVYQLGHEDTAYDIVWFMGVLYHLRYPLLALDMLAGKTRRMMVFQTLTMPGKEELKPPPNFKISERRQMRRAGWPKMAFIERRLANDPTNWWAPNHACVHAMLRSCGLKVLAHPCRETYICVPGGRDIEGMKKLNEAEYRAVFGR